MEKGWECGICFCGGWFVDLPWGCQCWGCRFAWGSGGLGTHDPEMSVVYIVRLEFYPTNHSATGCSRQHLRTSEKLGWNGWTWLDPATPSVIAAGTLRSRVPPRRMTFSRRHEVYKPSARLITPTYWFCRFKQIRISRELQKMGENDHDHLFELSPSHREVVQPMNIRGWWFQHVRSSFRKGLPFNLSQIIRSFGAVQVTSFSFLALLCADMMFTDVDGATSARQRFGSPLCVQPMVGPVRLYVRNVQ